jgi:hypothetical protein
VENGGLARLRRAEAKGILASFLFQEINIYSYSGFLGISTKYEKKFKTLLFIY